MLFATSCQDEVLVQQSQEGELFTLEVSRDIKSRTILGEKDAQGNIPTWWCEDAAIYVSGKAGNVSGKLKFVDYVNGDKTKAMFSGFIFGGSKNELEHIVFPVPVDGKIE